MKIYRRLVLYARPYWLHILGLLLLGLLATPLTLLTPLPLMIAVDSVIGSEPLPGILATLLSASSTSAKTAVLILAAGLLLVIALLNNLQSFGKSLLYTYAGEKLVLTFRSMLFRHLQRLPLIYHDMRGTADSTYRVQWDAPAIKYILIDSLIPIVTNSITFVSMIFILIWLDWQLALVALAVIPMLLLLVLGYRRGLRHKWRQVKELESSALSVVQEVLAIIRVVKAFGREDHEKRRFVHQSNRGLGAHVRAVIASGGIDAAIWMTISLGTALVLYLGVKHVLAGMLTLGELLMAMTYTSQLYGPLETISRQAGKLQSHLASAERALSLLDEAPEVVEHPHARPISRAAGSVAFANVFFSYNGSAPVLRDISVAIPPGSLVGIAGKTGAGKTTLMNLLIRFYDPTGGQILLDGVDLRDYKLADLRNQFSIVLQEPVVFSTSIGENIAYARPVAGQGEIIQAAQAANAHEFIVNLPDGYNTIVGERGMRLSGGERQRIALACAFLRDAPILILDEPTSSVDIKTEAKIMEAMERLVRGRTTFMIAHRLTTLENCNVLLVLENGRMVEVESNISSTIREAAVTGGLKVTL